MDTVNIIGGGIAGLSLANALHRANIDFKLFEQAPKLTEVGAAIGISKAAFDILDLLNLGKSIKDAGCETRTVCLSDKHLDVIRAVELEWPSVIIHRAKLIDILAANLPKDKIQLDAKLTAVISETNFATLKFANGSEIKSGCTVMADGIHSTSRKQLFPEIKIRYAGHTIWRGITAMQLPKQYRNTYTEIWADAKRFLFAPMDSKYSCWLAVQNAKVGGQDNPETIRQDLINDYRDFHPLVKELLLKSSNSIRNDLADLGDENRKWYHNKVVFIGDAIHATTPNFAQGGCQAIEDAYCLSLLLKKHQNNFSYTFPIYQGLRNEKVSFIVNGSWKFGKIVHHSLSWRIAKQFFKYAPKSFSVKMDRKLNDLSYLDLV